MARISFFAFFFFAFMSCQKEEENRPETMAQDFYQSYDLQADSLQYKDDTLFYDLDLNGSNDIVLTKYVDYNSSSVQYGGQFYALTDSIVFFYILENPTRLLIEGDSVFERQNIQWLDTVKYNGSGPIGTLKNSNVFVPFIGMKKVDSQRYFGWIRCSKLDFRETSLNRSPNIISMVGR